MARLAPFHVFSIAILSLLFIQFLIFYYLIPTSDLHEIGSRVIAETKIIIQQVSSYTSLISSTSSTFHLSLNENVYNWILSLIISRYSNNTLNYNQMMQIGVSWKYYTPINIEFQRRDEMLVELCQLNYQQYYLTPHLYPMYKALISASDCTINGQGKLIKQTFTDLQNDILHEQQLQLPTGRIVYPTGFIFHESRVGSTLLANILTKDPLNLVYSESSPPVSAVFCGACPDSTAISRFINTITLMGRSPYHQRLFFKFQSIMTTKIHIILQAYPDVPWIFLYRKPVQVMMSHISPWKITTAVATPPCLRSKSTDPPMLVAEALSLGGFDSTNASDIAWCAGHLYMLCKFGSKAYDDHHLYQLNDLQSHHQKYHHPSLQFKYYPMKRPSTGEIRGLLVDYENIPGILLSLIFPLWGLTPFATPTIHQTPSSNLSFPTLSFSFPSLLSFSSSSSSSSSSLSSSDSILSSLTALTPQSLRAMKEQSLIYSKNGNRLGSGGKFQEDSENKDNWANKEINSLSVSILDKIYQTLRRNSEQDLSSLVKTALLHSSSSSSSPSPAAASAASAAGNSKLSPEDLKIIPLPEINFIPSKVNEIHSTSQSLNEDQETLTWSTPGIFDTEHSSKPYHPPSCPSNPSKDYPKTYPLSSILTKWNPHNTSIPSKHFKSLCSFDFIKQFKEASQYRQQEVPFVLTNHPEVNKALIRWKNFSYLEEILGKNSLYRSEYSQNQHFMYWNNDYTVRGMRGPEKRSEGEGKGKGSEGEGGETERGKWTPPTERIYLTFREWLEYAIKNYDQEKERSVSTSQGYKYFRVSGFDNLTSPLFKELSLFQTQKSFFIIEPNEQNGIHCRFSMKSTIVECHYDANRNFIINLGGLRRWILAHPSQCHSLYLYPFDHPSSRHCRVDWSHLNSFHQYPLLGTAQMSEVILSPGEILYLPTGWFHYLISLNINYQCNTRSGTTLHELNYLKKCGF